MQTSELGEIWTVPYNYRIQHVIYLDVVCCFIGICQSN